MHNISRLVFCKCKTDPINTEELACMKYCVTLLIRKVIEKVLKKMP